MWETANTHLDAGPPCEPPRRGVTRRALGQGAAALAAGGGLAALLAAACGPLQSQAPATVKGGGELYFLHWRLPWPQKLVPMFEQYTQRTGTRITVEETNLNEYPAKLVTTMAAGTPPDVMYSYSQNDSKHYDAGQILDIKARLARDKVNLRRDYNLMGTEYWCDKVYAMPFISEPFVVWYNRSLLQQAGVRDPWADGKADWTWDDLVAIARKVSTAVGARDIQAARWGLDWPYTNVTYFAPNVWTFDGDIVDFEKMRWTLDSPVVLEAFRRYSAWAVKERIAMLPGDWTAVSQAYPGRNRFQAGKVAFTFANVHSVQANRQTIGNEFEWDVLHVPRQGRRLGVPMNAGHPHIIAAQSKYPDQAYDFVKYLASPEVQDFVGRTGITLPALKAKLDTFLVPPPAHIRVFREVYERPRGIHFRHHNTPDNWATYGKEIVPIVTGERPLEAGLRELNRMLNDKVQYGQCAPYKGLKHPLPAGA